jgi:hypothetical protein
VILVRAVRPGTRRSVRRPNGWRSPSPTTPSLSTPGRQCRALRAARGVRGVVVRDCLVLEDKDVVERIDRLWIARVEFVGPRDEDVSGTAAGQLGERRPADERGRDEQSVNSGVGKRPAARFRLVPERHKRQLLEGLGSVPFDGSHLVGEPAHCGSPLRLDVDGECGKAVDEARQWRVLALSAPLYAPVEHDCRVP